MAGMALAFTLEPRLAIVKSGPRGSYFGFSVAGHQIPRGTQTDRIVLVGAPLDKGGGTLWSCPYTNLMEDCSRVMISKRGQALNSSNDEWFGATVHAQSPFTWRGTVFAMNVGDDFLFRDKTQFHTPVQGVGITLDKYSYLGMSIAVGNFLPRSMSCGQAETYASGAPRAGNGGKVMLFSKCNGHIMPIHTQLAGDGFASSFGYALATVDLNGDGWDDLIVGAPFYSDKIGAGGAIYVYPNSPQGLAEDSQRMKWVMPKAESRFGFSMANAGDLNNDQIADLIVGAPYDGRGRLYVYLGHGDFFSQSDTTPIQRADQIIAAEQLPINPSQVHTFGYSLFGGMDFDMNNHSDIGVGAFGSDQMFILRSRPVIDILTWFGEHPKVLEPSSMTCPEYEGHYPDTLGATPRCFKIEACFEIKQFPKNVESAHLAFQLEAEIFPGGRKISRIQFDGSNETSSNHISRKILEIRRSSLSGCFQEVAFLKEASSDLTVPLKFKLSLWLQQDEPVLSRNPMPQNIDHYPVLNTKETDKILTIPFLKHCGDDNLCQASLSIKIRFQEDQIREDDGVISVSPTEELAFHLDVVNEGEPAYGATLDFELDPSFAYIGRADHHHDIHCSYSETTLTVHCILGNPFQSGEASLVFRVGAQAHTQIMYSSLFKASVSTTSDNLAPQSATDGLSFRSVKKSEVSLQASVQPREFWYGGQVRGESAIKTTNDIGSKVIHTFHVSNAGPWSVNSLELVVQWPIQLAPTFPNKPGKWLLYLTEDPELLPRGSGSCFYNSKSINALGLPPSSRIQRRHIAEDAIPTLECHPRNDVITCMEIRCQLNKLNPNSDVVVKIRSRVWNSTLVDDFPDLDQVLLRVQGQLLLPDGVKLHQDGSNDQVVVDVLGYPSHPLKSSLNSIPKWILICAALAGCLVVCIIGLILNQFGFFKRKRVSNTYKGAFEQPSPPAAMSLPLI
eukprot:snap_masked-scaffold1121_size61474-processed-gene-0.4 protein:Tk07065 transcript:snap_masked-scaffold1121_size61474-processed-gene-0.4-mRNA-1 annotation:"hypothetical protein DAPPUDRAFT_60396"